MPFYSQTEATQFQWVINWKCFFINLIPQYIMQLLVKNQGGNYSSQLLNTAENFKTLPIKKNSVLNPSYIVLLFHFFLQIQMITEIDISFNDRYYIQ